MKIVEFQPDSVNRDVLRLLDEFIEIAHDRPISDMAILMVGKDGTTHFNFSCENRTLLIGILETLKVHISIEE